MLLTTQYMHWPYTIPPALIIVEIDVFFTSKTLFISLYELVCMKTLYTNLGLSTVLLQFKFLNNNPIKTTFGRRMPGLKIIITISLFIIQTANKYSLSPPSLVSIGQVVSEEKILERNNTRNSKNLWKRAITQLWLNGIKLKFDQR